MASVMLTKGAQAELDQLPSPIYVRVLKVIERLADWPDVSGAKPLRGALAGRFRMRTGDYRIQFYPRGAAVAIERIGHRDGFYDE